MVGKYYKDVKKAITDSTKESTVEIYGEYTIPANTTVDVKGAVTGTIKGTNSTSKLTVGDNGTYGELAKGTYVWINDSWVKEGTNIIENGGLTNDNGQLKASFIWSSSENIGTEKVEENEETNGLSYYKDGVYLRLQVKKDDQVLAFNKVFKSATDNSEGKHDVNSKECGLLLKTTTVKGTNVATPKYNDLDGSKREKADWQGEEKNGKTPGTKLDDRVKEKYIFYGVRQDSAKGTRTVGFADGDVREIELVLNPLSNLANGTYTVTIQLMQQNDSEADRVIGNPITYSFTKK